MILTRKVNGEVTKEVVTYNEAEEVRNALARQAVGTCWGTCPVELCNANEEEGCPKVRDLKKKDIDKYEFINSGASARTDDGELSFLIVTDCEKCNKYVKEHPKVKKRKRQ